MTDAPNAATEKAASAEDGKSGTDILKLAVDLGPVLIFVLVYNFSKSWVGDDAVFLATGVYMAAAVAAVLTAKLTQDRLPPMLIITTVIVLVFGGLSLGFRLAGSEYADDFAYVKPTIINGLFAVAIIGSLLIGKNVWKMFFGSVFTTLPDRVWDIFAWRWSGFFIFLAILNMVLAYAPPDMAFWIADKSLSPEAFAQARETFWANAKLVNIPLTMGFMLANYPLMAKYLPQDDKEKAAS